MGWGEEALVRMRKNARRNVVELADAALGLADHNVTGPLTDRLLKQVKREQRYAEAVVAIGAAIANFCLRPGTLPMPALTIDIIAEIAHQTLEKLQSEAAPPWPPQEG